MLSRLLPARLDNDFRGNKGAIFVVVLLRYRALIPLMFLLAIVAQAGALALAAWKPLSLTVSSGAAPVHLVLSALYVAGLVLSLLADKSADAPPGADAR